MITLVKVLASFFLLGVFLAGCARASRGGRDPERNPTTEYITGAIGVIGGALGLLFLWF